MSADAQGRGQAAVDVLIPAYNAEATLETSLRSIRDQTVHDIRIIVVDDGSTDRTGELLRGMAAGDPRLEVISTPNRGIVAALNLALEHSTAPVIARHDADDIAFPDRLERQLAYLRDHPDCVALGCEVYQVLGDGSRIGRTYFTRQPPPDPAALPAVEPYLLHPFLLVRAEAMRAVGGYRHLPHAEDADLYWRLLEMGRLHNMPDILGEYRIHAGSVTGASVHHGRVGSAYAELAALSFRRRAQGLPDLSFPADALARTNALSGTQEVVDQLSRALVGDEAAHLRLGTAGKLLRNASFRPYLLETEDCRFIARARPALQARLDRAGRKALRRSMGTVLWKLLQARRWSAARALRAPPLVWGRLPPWLVWTGLKRLRPRTDVA